MAFLAIVALGAVRYGIHRPTAAPVRASVQDPVMNCGRADMRHSKPIILLLFALAIVAGCASSEVTTRRSEAGAEFIPRPARIIVYDFAATPADIPPQSAIANRTGRRPKLQTPDQIALGRELGGRVAQRLVSDILKMGLPAERAGGPPPQNGNIIILGGFLSLDEGSRAERVIIGFGAGANKIRTYVEGYQVTASGWKPIGSGEIVAGGGKTPGMILPTAIGIVTGEYVRSAIIGGALALYKEIGPEKITAAANRTADSIAEELRKAFQRRGWI